MDPQRILEVWKAKMTRMFFFVIKNVRDWNFNDKSDKDIEDWVNDMERRLKMSSRGKFS